MSLIGPMPNDAPTMNGPRNLINCTVTGALLTSTNSDLTMARITTAAGKILWDQRGVYLYDGRGGEEVMISCPSDTAPAIHTVPQMVRMWEACCDYGDYILHLW